MTSSHHAPGDESSQAAARRRREERIGIMRRFYAMVPIVVVVFLSYHALRYLIVSLVFPHEAPAQIKEIPKRLTAEVWETRRDEWTGVEVTEVPRTPLAHYHRIEGWFQPDPHNGCTQSGCHSPLPHNRHKEVRAFLNMHATSIHCGVCHFRSDEVPRPLTWYDLRTGRATGPPALLEAYAWCLSPAGQKAVENPTLEDQKHIVKLVRQAARDADNLRGLRELADQLRGYRYTSERFKTLLAELPMQLPSYFHGEYNKKLALLDKRTGQPLLQHPNSEAAIAEFLAKKARLAPDQLKAEADKLHTLRAPETLKCTACHRQETSLVDLSTVGYPEPRIRSLYERWIFQAIQDIREGRPLYLPGFIGPGSEPAPASEPSRK